MRYFTPELIARGRTDDDNVLNEVEALWDDRCDQYGAYIQSVKDELPPGLRHIEDSYYLHDAKVQAMGRQDGTVVMVLQLDTPPYALLIFTYDLVGEPRIDPEALPESARIQGGTVLWQYDEVERVTGRPPTWRQSILFTNGWEVVLHFRDIRVQAIQAVIPAPRNGAATPPGAGLPQPA